MRCPQFPPNVTFLMVNRADHITPITGLKVVARISKDGDAFEDCANKVIKAPDKMYKINLTQAERDADYIVLQFTAPGADSVMVTSHHE